MKQDLWPGLDYTGSARWQHCLTRLTDDIQKPAKWPDSSRRSYAAERQSVKRHWPVVDIAG